MTDRKEYYKPIVLAGPSGVGKGTLIEKLKKKYGDLIAHSVSHTSRHSRPGEIDGHHYNFVERSEMQKQIDEGKFIEYASVHGNLYGTSFEAVEKILRENKICILDLDVQGCKILKGVNFAAFMLFIAPPSIKDLEERLKKRGTETDGEIVKRIETAKIEMESINEPDFWDEVIVNDNLDEALAKVEKYIVININGSREQKKQ